MYPTILRWESGLPLIGTLEIGSYFLAVALAMVIGTVLVWRWAGRHGVDRRDALDFCLYVAVFGLIGAKLMHVVADGFLDEYVHMCTDPSQVFWDKWRVGAEYCRELQGVPQRNAAGEYLGCVPTHSNCFGWINLLAGGYTWYGGLLGGALAGGLLVRSRRLPLWPMLDALAFIGFLGLGIGRVGCFLNGCCFGRTTDSWVGVVFRHNGPAWIEHGQRGWIGYTDPPLPVIPTQLFEAAVSFALAAFLRGWLEPRKRYPGQVLVVGVSLYALARIVLETFRADPRGGLLGLSTSQLVGFAALAGMFFLHRRLSARAVEPAAAGPDPDPPADPRKNGEADRGEGD